MAEFGMFSTLFISKANGGLGGLEDALSGSEIMNPSSLGLNSFEIESLTNLSLCNWNVSGNAADHKGCQQVGEIHKDGFIMDYSRLKRVSSGRYKTELCRPFEETGECKYGEKCQFAHGAHELRQLPRHPKYKTELCRTFHTSGFCPYGPRCHFIHKEDQALRFSGAICGNDVGCSLPPFTPPPVPHPDWAGQLKKEVSDQYSFINESYASLSQLAPHCQQSISKETVLTLAKLINSLNLKSSNSPKMNSPSLSINKIFGASKLKCSGWSERSGDVRCQSYGFSQ